MDGHLLDHLVDDTTDDHSGQDAEDRLLSLF
jgi:hypothetical protein